jgi:L-ornithine N5-monooxygenase
MTQAIASPAVHDLIGIGFGPSNLALAIALQEREKAQGKLDVLFLDKQADYRWHGNTLVSQSELQISFLKDLVTLRNPTSPYSFVNYLKVHGRLVDFINLGTFYPCRMEYNDYLRWVAGQFTSARARYGEEVLAIEPILHQQQVEALRVISRDAQGEQLVRTTRARWWSAPVVRRGFPRRSRRSRTMDGCSTTPSTWRAWPSSRVSRASRCALQSSVAGRARPKRLLI